MPDEVARRFAQQDDRHTASDLRATAQDEHAGALDARGDAMDIRSDAQDAKADERARQYAAELEGQADQLKWQDQIAKDRYVTTSARLRSIALGLAVAALAAGVAMTFTIHGARKANAAAERANRAADCSNLLLGSVANRVIDPRADALHCDTTVARDLIDRGLERDAEVRRTQALLTRDACALLSLFPGPPNGPEVVAFRRDFGCPS